MNRLDPKTRKLIIRCLVEDMTIRATARTADVSKNTVVKLLMAAGSRRCVDVDGDLRPRLANRVQLTSDGHKAYLEAVEGAFGGDVDHAQLIKLYGSEGGVSSDKRYSPAECTGTRKRRVEGNPDPKHVSTSYAERNNLAMRMLIRCFTRLTNAFSKKIENHAHSVALHFMHYNFCRQPRRNQLRDGRWRHRSAVGYRGYRAAGGRSSPEAWSAWPLQEKKFKLTRYRCSLRIDRPDRDAYGPALAARRTH